jgi:hypothetical protein
MSSPTIVIQKPGNEAKKMSKNKVFNCTYKFYHRGSGVMTHEIDRNFDLKHQKYVKPVGTVPLLLPSRAYSRVSSELNSMQMGCCHRCVQKSIAIYIRTTFHTDYMKMSFPASENYAILWIKAMHFPS